MTKKTKKEAEEARGRFACPVGEFFAKMDRLRIKDSGFSEHLSQSGLEFLRAMRSLLDAGIQGVEKKSERKPKARATKIEME